MTILPPLWMANVRLEDKFNSFYSGYNPWAVAIPDVAVDHFTFCSVFFSQFVSPYHLQSYVAWPNKFE